MAGDIDMDRQPHRLTKAVFQGAARRRDGQPGLPPADRDVRPPKSEAALGTRKDWVKETTSNSPNITSAAEVSYTGLLISTRVLKGIQYRFTFHARSFTGDTAGFGFALQIRDEGGVAVGAAIGPKVQFANVGENGGAFVFMYVPETTAYKTFQLKASRVSGSGIGNIQATSDNKTLFMLEVVGNEDLVDV